MTEESSGLILNLTTVPVKKKKNSNPNLQNAGNFQDTLRSSDIFQANFKSSVTLNRKPKKSVKFQPKSKSFRIENEQSSKLKSYSLNEVVTRNIDNQSRDLKIKTESQSSLWKRFKESHKKKGPNKVVKPELQSKSFKKTIFVNNSSNSLSNNSKKMSLCSEKNQINNTSLQNSCDSKPSDLNFVKPVDNSPCELNETNQFNSENFQFIADQQKKKSKKNWLYDKDALQKYIDNRQSKSDDNRGKITSLFYNNPEIPEIPHRMVKPVKEIVFSNQDFKDMKLHPYLVKYLKESMGLSQMTKVQEKSIPVLLENNDALIKSQTGSGKTLAFALPILHKCQEIRPKINRSDGVLALIIVPTRELALQTYELFNKLVKSYTWIVPGYLIGGEKRKSEKARLRKGITILIGTPGRVLDHIKNTKCLKLDKVSWLVIDEADRLLDMGYERDVSTLLETLNQNNASLLHPSYIYPNEEKAPEKEKQRQTILLSATLTPKVQKLAGLSLSNPVFVNACDENLPTTSSVPILGNETAVETDIMVLPDTLAQLYLVTPPKLKLVTLASFILWKSNLSEEKKLLIFMGTQDMVDYYTELLTFVCVNAENRNPDLSQFSTQGIEIFKLHGNMKQNDRTEVFKTFRKSNLGILICTDVAARGLDLPEVDWVVQFTGPTSVSDYVHRVGRTARGGQSGSSIIFLTPNEVRFIEKLENSQIRLREKKMEECLSHLLSINDEARSAEEAATKLQMAFEEMVAENAKLYDLACKAYSSWSRFYASYPKNMRDVFSVKTVHQGHYAKSFALRDAPSVIVSYAKNKNLNEKRFPRKRPLERKEPGMKKRFGGKSRFSQFSEFDSGLEPLPKKKK